MKENDKRNLEAKTRYEGMHFLTKDGVKEFIIVNYNSSTDVTIEFIESGYIKKTTISNINSGITNPFANSPHVAFEDPAKALAGSYFHTNGGGIIRIVDASSYSHVKYQFQDEFGYSGETTIQNIRKGQIRNPYNKDSCGGYIGEGPYSSNEFTPLRELWRNLLQRGTGARAKYGIKYGGGDYDNFAEWYLSSIANLNPNYQYDVDKDLMYPFYKYESQGLKVYSPVTCELLPHDLNVMIYDPRITRNEIVRQQIIELGEKYYQEHAISQRAYDAIDIIYKGNKDKQIYISLNESGYNEYIPRLDDFEDTY